MANETVICTYRVRSDAEDRFATLLEDHWATLHRLGFVTDGGTMAFRSVDEPPTFVEIFTWVDGGFAMAHDHPEVLAIWEPMGELLEDRGPLPKWEFPHFQPLQIGA